MSDCYYCINNIEDQECTLGLNIYEDDCPNFEFDTGDEEDNENEKHKTHPFSY